ncbi:MAG: hypothetical protein XD60_0411 [Acetothermia bacterium 64_32]|nr:MAG: hypothetical protein XD60_0411 [Acetothermia bacterium 64_32]HAF71024.1 hypothetical protein [Candidatus Acetothermia bacterium]
MKRMVLVSAAVLGLWAWALPQGLTADEILDRVEEKTFIGVETGSMMATISLAVTAEGETTGYTFKVFFQEGEGEEPDKALVVYLEPELVSGTMFLTWTPEEGDARMWLYLPDLGIVKELVGQSREQEFVSGSGISYEDLAQGFKYREDYKAELVGEEVVDGLPAYLIVLTPKEGAEADYSQVKLWVEKEYFNVIKMESYSDGELVSTMRASELSDDGLGYIPHRFEFQDLDEGTSSVLDLLERVRAEVPADYFDPGKLPSLEVM